MYIQFDLDPLKVESRWPIFSGRPRERNNKVLRFVKLVSYIFQTFISRIHMIILFLLKTLSVITSSFSLKLLWCLWRIDSTYIINNLHEISKYCHQMYGINFRWYWRVPVCWKYLMEINKKSILRLMRNETKHFFAHLVCLIIVTWVVPVFY